MSGWNEGLHWIMPIAMHGLNYDSKPFLSTVYVPPFWHFWNPALQHSLPLCQIPISFQKITSLLLLKGNFWYLQPHELSVIESLPPSPPIHRPLQKKQGYLNWVFHIYLFVDSFNLWKGSPQNSLEIRLLCSRSFIFLFWYH